MGTKHPLSPFVDECDRDDKRVRLWTPGEVPLRQCLHCGREDHNFAHCQATCLHCGGMHPQRRCSQLDVECYAPGGFSRPVSLKLARSTSAVKIPQAGSQSTNIIHQPLIPSVVTKKTMAEGVVQYIWASGADPLPTQETDEKAAKRPASEPIATKAESVMIDTPRSNPQPPAIAAYPVAAAPGPAIKLEPSVEPDMVTERRGMSTLPLDTKLKGGTSKAQGKPGAILCNGTVRNEVKKEELSQARSAPNSIALSSCSSATAPLPLHNWRPPNIAVKLPPSSATTAPRHPKQPNTTVTGPHSKPAPQPVPQQRKLPQHRDPAREQAALEAVEAAIRKAIQDAAAHAKPFNSPYQVDLRVGKALAVLKPVILGTEPPQKDRELEKAAEKVRELEKQGMKISIGPGNSWTLGNPNGGTTTFNTFYR